MALNIACFVRGCNNPVIGQCQGYKESCGHFYCVQHSHGKLCAECNKRKSDEKAAQDLYQDYSHAAEKLTKQVDSLEYKLSLISVGVLIVIGLFGFLISSLIPTLGSVIVLVTIPVAIYLKFEYMPSKLRPFINTQINMIGADRPGFVKFYEEWRKQKKRAATEATLKLALIGLLVVAGAGAAESSENSRIRRAVDDELNRHGL